ncbi:MAG: phosphate/phosphite/phosphonate ABC transporter substrate-binding protein [Sulfurimonas sp.]|jgi:phosphonate transport system substrate-binding protein
MKYILVAILLNQFMLESLFALTFGVVPQQSPLQLIKVWKPVIEYLEKETGENIDLKIEYSIPEFEKVLYSGGYDIAYMNPYHYIIANQKQGYLASIKATKNIVGILVTNKNSGISDISMTKNKMFLFPAPDAFAATLLIKYELLKNYGIKIEEKNVKYVNSHDSVYKGVSRGVGDFGGGIERTLNTLDDTHTKESLAILHKTKAYPSHPFAYKPSLNDAIKEKISQALLHMPQELLNPLNIEETIKTNDAGYDVVRDIAKKIVIEKN